MKISLSEIWNFSDLIDADEKGWSYQLHAGKVCIEGISQAVLQTLRNNGDYDTELLPSIFTFREILWQPDVFTEASMSLPGLRILHSFCMDTVAEYQESDIATTTIYAKLLEGLAACCEEAVQGLEKERPVVNKILGDFRTQAFPIVKFFIFHPQNRLDYYRDAVNRLNYAVKIMLTQFHGRYTELKDPYWEVSYDKPTATKSKKTDQEKKEVKED